MVIMVRYYSICFYQVPLLFMVMELLTLSQLKNKKSIFFPIRLNWIKICQMSKTRTTRYASLLLGPRAGLHRLKGEACEQQCGSERLTTSSPKKEAALLCRHCQFLQCKYGCHGRFRHDIPEHGVRKRHTTARLYRVCPPQRYSGCR